MSPKTAKSLRSYRWYGPDDLRSFGHRSRAASMGCTPADYAGKPVIAIINTWSDANPCHSPVSYTHLTLPTNREV